MKFDKAKIVLRDAALKVGNDLFVREALLKIGQIQADADVAGAKKDLDLAQFVEKLFDSKSIYDEKNEGFWEFISAIAVLDEYQKRHNKANLADTKGRAAD